jgi:glutathione S-transferase
VNLYFAPLACSLATRIACYEANVPVQFTQVNTRTKTASSGADFWRINPLGQVPALELDDGSVLTENTAILEYVAELHPQADLLPATSIEKARLRQWLGFISTELHKAVFVPLLDSSASAAAKDYARSKAQLRLDRLQSHLSNHSFLVDRFTIADAYLATVLNWAAPTKVDLAGWPSVAEYHQRMHQRPSVAKAFAEERALYVQEQARPA